MEPDLRIGFHGYSLAQLGFGSHRRANAYAAALRATPRVMNATGLG